MGSIKPLPEGVRSPMLSGIIIFDLTRVVEELVFNSLDAGATKVSVAVGVGTCYVKVADNGSGITRDGLVLLGERYATSKFDELADMNTSYTTFGFKGQALSSISDFSLLEIVTKAHGRPNGYRKVMKGCKCLYLGIDNARQDVGTTVTVRDLFYNQPVRRKHIQSSPKKILHSIKECVLRIALMQSKVAFQVVDTESEDELLCTHPSSSPLPLLMSCFGIDVSSSLQELNASDGVLKLSGYMSSPFGTSSVKAFQYVYINSRFICKGPIHKVLNQLAARFNYSDTWKGNSRSQYGKRNTCHAYPSYILNISCLRSLYDLAFEPSKTSVEFKDWVNILTFIEKASKDFWGVNTYYDFPENHEITRKRRRAQNDRSSIELPSPQPKMLIEECNGMSGWTDSRYPCQKSHENTLNFKHHQSEVELICENNDLFLPYCESLVPCKGTVNETSGSHLWTPDISSTEDDILENKFFAGERSGEDVYHISCFKSGNDIEEVNKGLERPFLQSCSSRRFLLPDMEPFASNDRYGYLNDRLRMDGKSLDHDDKADIGEVADIDQGFQPRTLWQDQEASASSPPRLMAKCEMLMGSESLTNNLIKSTSVDREFNAKENYFRPDSIARVEKIVSSNHPFASEWSPAPSDPFLGMKTPDIEHITDENLFENCIEDNKSASFDIFVERESRKCNFNNDIMQDSSGQEFLLLSSCKNLPSDIEFYAGSKRHYSEFLPRYDTFTDETDWLCLDKCGKSNTKNNLVPVHCVPSSNYVDEEIIWRDQITFQEKAYVCGKRLKRSHSAPPFHRAKRKFLALKHHFTLQAGKFNSPDIHNIANGQGLALGTSKWKQTRQSSGVCHLCSEWSPSDSSPFNSKPDMKMTAPIIDIQNRKTQKEDQHYRIFHKDSIEDLTSRDIQDELDFALKWRSHCLPTVDKGKAQKLCNQETILDISSGILHLSGDSLVPESLSKNCLEDAKVLQQVDKKFIPVVAGRTLALIDQHAADERIRLEELRQKVLSGEMKTITYLDAEQELVLPEIGYQFLHNYAEQIQSWGWICNNHAQGSRSFKKNLSTLHKQPANVTLLAVPCILGVCLSDVDLLEFLQQLADTDGSSTIPPSVLRVLNLKACRGAIMFGDTLLPSECSLIVEELKQTSLCFQCAHGRPTTAALVNLENLHKQIAKLELWRGGSDESWHGLRRRKISLVRATRRLSSALVHC